MTRTSKPSLFDSSLLSPSSPFPLASASPPSLRQQLRLWMEERRQLTLTLFAGINCDSFCRQAHPDFSPIGWHLGHIAYTESLWLLEHLAEQPCPFPQYRRLFAADGLPKSERVYLPNLEETQDYLSRVRQQVFDYLAIAPIEQQEPIWRFLLQHESQHCETVTLVLELLRLQGEGDAGEEEGGSRGGGVAGRRRGGRGEGETRRRGDMQTEMVCIPAGDFICGNNSVTSLDNERPAHRVYLGTYWIDRYPVTCAQYQVFIAAGGYQTPGWWSADGWAWLQTANITQPLYWQDDPAWGTHPVSGVSWYEAEAYARFVGKRLPTELEWEKAARWNPATEQSQTYPWGEAEPGIHHCNHRHAVGHTTPVDAYPAGTSPAGCQDMLGNVWEWTASWFDRYEGFQPFPYRGYSQTYFDRQHRVLRGGSWATCPWSMRAAFRNWYHPHVREVLAGFRCARSE